MVMATTPTTTTTATARKALLALSAVIDERDVLAPKVAALNASVTSLTAQVATLTAQVTAATTARDAALAQVASLTTTNTALTAQAATLQAQVDALTSQLAAATAARDALQTDRDTLAMQVSGLATQVLSLQSQVADLQAQLAAATKPPVVDPPAQPRASFIVGASTEDPRLGPLPFERTYAAGGIGKPNKTPRAHSFKTWDQDALTAWVKGAATGSTITYFHEPEDNVETGKLVIAQWVTRQIALCQTIIDCKRVGEVRPATILMGWSLTNRKDMIPQFADPALVAIMKKAQGVWGWDQYLATSADDPTAKSGKELFGPLAAYSASLGLPWGIFETGARQQSAKIDGAKAAAWWQATFDYLGTNPPTHFLMWNPTTVMSREGSSDTWTYDFQSLPAVVAVWKKAITTYNPTSLRQSVVAESLTERTSPKPWWRL